MCKSVFFSFLCFASLLSFADWTPEFLENVDTSVLTDSNYQQLKSKVLRSLKGTWCSEEKTNLMMDLVLLKKPKMCVEIGAFTGSSVLPIATTLQFLKSGEIYAIDAWSNAIATRYWSDNDPNKAWWAGLDMKFVKQTFKDMVKTWKLKSCCKILQAPSEELIHQMSTIDFLHIDGDYSEVGSLKDVQLYLPKVRSGGYVLFSNLCTMVNGKQPKIKAFLALLEDCEIVCEIEEDNAVLFKKK